MFDKKLEIVAEENPYDEIVGLPDPEEVKRYLREQQVSGEKIDNLIHQVFAQNEQGKVLLELWGETLIMMPTVEPGEDLIQAGINEGTKRFIRNILITIQKVERGTDHE